MNHLLTFTRKKIIRHKQKEPFISPSPSLSHLASCTLHLLSLFSLPYGATTITSRPSLASFSLSQPIAIINIIESIAMHPWGASFTCSRKFNRHFAARYFHSLSVAFLLFIPLTLPFGRSSNQSTACKLLSLSPSLCLLRLSGQIKHCSYMCAGERERDRDRKWGVSIKYFERSVKEFGERFLFSAALSHSHSTFMRRW